MEPSGQEPDVPLPLRHALLEGLAHDDPGGLREELPDDDAGAALLQVAQILNDIVYVVEKSAIEFNKLQQQRCISYSSG